MIEPEFAYTLTSPEIEMLEVIRLAHMSRFSLSVTHAADEFTVKLTDLDGGRFVEGRGATFEDAWRALWSSDLLGMDLDLKERIAARSTKIEDRLTIVGGTAR